jgi:hypothetical protein
MSVLGPDGLVSLIAALTAFYWVAKTAAGCVRQFADLQDGIRRILKNAKKRWDSNPRPPRRKLSMKLAIKRLPHVVRYRAVVPDTVR